MAAFTDETLTEPGDVLRKRNISMGTRLGSWRPLVWYAVVTAPLSLATLYAKVRWLELEGYRTVARALGRQGAASLTPLERLSLLRGDLLLATVVLPLSAIVLARLLRPAARPWLISLLCMMCLLAFYAQSRAFASVGHFTTAPMWWSAVRFALQRPDLIREYVPLSGSMKVLGLMALTTVLAAWVATRQSHPVGGGAAPRALRRASVALWVLPVAATAAGWLPVMRETAYHAPYLTRALAAFWSGAKEGPGQFAALGPRDLMRRYRTLVGAEASPRDERYWSRAAGANLVLIVLETVPAKCLDLRGGLDSMPALRRLRERALVAAGHYVSYPYTSSSNFSLLTSWYPPTYARRYVERHLNQRIPSLIWQLWDRGYHTALYQPYPARIEDDPDMYRALGFERQIAPSPAVSATRGWKGIARADSAAMLAMLADIARWSAAGQPYAVMFTPEITHGPWHDVTAGRARNPAERCQALVRIYDGWIGTIASAVSAGRAIIVVTGDHGVRTAETDPSFHPETLDDYSFHVPLLIHSRASFDSTIYVASVSSSLDVVPTLLDLLGIERDRDLEQGNALWDNQLLHRTTFFLASTYFGADAYHRADVFAAWNRVTNMVWVTHRPALQLSPSDILGFGAPEADSITSVIRAISALQVAWLERMPLAGADAGVSRGSSPP